MKVSYKTGLASLFVVPLVVMVLAVAVAPAKAEAASTVIVQKRIINTSNVLRNPQDFSFTITGMGVNTAQATSTQSSFTFPGSGGGTAVTVYPGSYAVTEAPAAGFTASYSAGCSGTIADGETRTCVVTNTFQGSVVDPGTGTGGTGGTPGLPNTGAGGSLAAMVVTMLAAGLLASLAAVFTRKVE